MIAVKRIVVADDTAFVRDRFSSAIENGGHRAITVRTGPELLARVRAAAGAIDLIVLDLRLPEGGGVELLHAIQAASERPVKILVFNGTISGVDEVRQLEELGVVSYVNEYMSAQHIVPTLSPYLFPAHYNRRSSPRVTLNTPVTCAAGDRSSAASIINISKGGLAIRTQSPLGRGAEVKVRFRLPGGRMDIDADARVAWVDRRVGMGVQFTRINASSVSAIERFVEAHFFSNRKAS